MKRILFVMPQLGEGGGERVVTTLIRQLSGCKASCHLLLLLPNGNNDYLKYLPEDVKVTVFNQRRSLRFEIFRIYLVLRRLIKKERINTVFFGSGTLNAMLSPLLVLLPSNVKKVARETNLPSIYESSKIAHFLYRTTYRLYDTVICQSDEMYNEMCLIGIDRSKLKKIRNPCDHEFILGSAITEKKIYSPGVVNVVAMGRLVYQKGFDLLIKWLSQSPYKLDGICVYIIGDGEMKDELKIMVKQFDLSHVIKFLPFKENPYPYIKQADLLISPSRWEGYPNIVIESLLVGTPVLANNYPGGISEISKSYNCTLFDINSCFAPEKQMHSAIGNLPLSSKVIELNQHILEEFVDVLT